MNKLFYFSINNANRICITLLDETVIEYCPNEVLNEDYDIVDVKEVDQIAEIFDPKVFLRPYHYYNTSLMVKTDHSIQNPWDFGVSQWVIGVFSISDLFVLLRNGKCKKAEVFVDECDDADTVISLSHSH